MSDRDAIAELLQQYYRGFDGGDVDLAAAVFTDDSEMSLTIRGQGEVGTYSGREGIREMLAGVAATVDEGEQRRHHLSGIHFEADEGDELTITSVILVTSAKDDSVGILTSGWQRDVAVRTDEGWRLRSRHLHVDAAF